MYKGTKCTQKHASIAHYLYFFLRLQSENVFIEQINTSISTLNTTYNELYAGYGVDRLLCSEILEG